MPCLESEYLSVDACMLAMISLECFNQASNLQLMRHIREELLIILIAALPGEFVHALLTTNGLQQMQRLRSGTMAIAAWDQTLSRQERFMITSTADSQER